MIRVKNLPVMPETKLKHGNKGIVEIYYSFDGFLLAEILNLCAEQAKLSDREQNLLIDLFYEVEDRNDISNLNKKFEMLPIIEFEGNFPDPTEYYEVIQQNMCFKNFENIFNKWLTKLGAPTSKLSTAKRQIVNFITNFVCEPLEFKREVDYIVSSRSLKQAWENAPYKFVNRLLYELDLEDIAIKNEDFKDYLRDEFSFRCNTMLCDVPNPNNVNKEQSITLCSFIKNELSWKKLRELLIDSCISKNGEAF